MTSKKQGTLSFGSSSTSSTSSTSSGQTDAEIKARIEDPVKYCKKQQERSVPKPSKDGSHFTLFANAEVRTKGGHRSVTKTAARLQTWSTKAVKQELPILSLAMQLMQSKTLRTEDMALAARTFVTGMPSTLYTCVPELQMRSQLMQCEYTQVRNTDGKVIGVRACCPCCESNALVEYEKLRSRPLDDYECMSTFIDVCCGCRNPECEAYQRELSKQNLSPTSPSIPHSIRYIFSNVDAKLIHELYPPIASSKYPLIVRARGGIATRLRREFFSDDSEADMHAKLVSRYQDYYKATTLNIYLEVVSCFPTEVQIFPVPSKTMVMNTPMSKDKMKAFIDKSWTDTDRTMIVRYLMTTYARHTIIADYTFEIARLLEGTSKCCLIILNELQEPLFIGFCPSESELNSTLAHWNLKLRHERMGKPKPINAIDDGCCNSHHKNVRLDTGVFVNIWGMKRPGRKDSFHFMQLGGRCLVPANKKGATVWRAKVVERLRAVIWEAPMSKNNMVEFYQRHLTVPDIYTCNFETQPTITTLDTFSLMGALINSTHHKHKTIKTAITAIDYIRKTKSLNVYIRKIRTTCDYQVHSIDSFLKQLKDNNDHIGAEMRKVVRKQTQFSDGFIEFLERARNHAARGCYESGLNLADQYLEIPPLSNSSLALPSYAVVETQSPLENLNRQVGDATRSLGGLRDVAIERGAMIKIFWYLHKRRLKLRLTTNKDPFEFLWNRSYQLVSDMFGERAVGFKPVAVDTTIPLEPMGLEYARKLKEQQLQKRTSSSSTNSSSSSSSHHTSTSTSSISSTSSSSISSTSFQTHTEGSAQFKSPPSLVAPIPHVVPSMSGSQYPSSTSSSSSSSFKSASAANKKNLKRKNLNRSQPFHQPSSLPRFSGAALDPYPYTRWSEHQKNFVAVQLSSRIWSLKRYERILESWLRRANLVDDQHFSLLEVPVANDIKEYDEHLGARHATEHANKLQEQSQPPKKKKKRVRKPATFHTNDDNQDDDYLHFPLTAAMTMTITVRRLRAYKTALGFASSNNVLRDNMTAEVTLRGGEWERPTAPPSGSAWSTWNVSVR